MALSPDEVDRLRRITRFYGPLQHSSETGERGLTPNE